MMTSILNDFQPAIWIPCCLHTIDTFFASSRVHPVVITIHERDAHVFAECIDAINKRQMGVRTKPEKVRDAVFARAFSESDARNVVMQITRFFG